MAISKKHDLEDYYSSLDYTRLESDIMLFENFDSEECVLELPDPVDALTKEFESASRAKSKIPINHNNRSESVVKINFDDKFCTTRRNSGNIESRMESVLSGLIEQRIQTKALPIALRKRLMYQRAINSC